MRIPHYLIKGPSGNFVFRQLVPRRLQAILGRRVIKHALRTSNVRLAQQRALAFAERYAQAFEEIGWQGMPKAPSAEDVLASVAGSGLSRYEIDLSTGRIRVDGPDDHALSMDALAKIGAVGLLRPMPPASVSTLAAAEAEPKSSVPAPISMKLAKAAWLKSLEPSTTKKTLIIKGSAIEDLVRFVGESRGLHTLTRADLAGWYHHLRDQGISTPTLTNKQFYVGGRNGFFAWAMASGHYPTGDNPAKGHISLRRTRSGSAASSASRRLLARRSRSFSPLSTFDVAPQAAQEAQANRSCSGKDRGGGEGGGLYDRRAFRRVREVRASCKGE
ncbi:DUF6538 domain-containing protein [Luteimonas sp. TWI1437]|uniref:DUF6538 domain-containing protein n=1 Tax=unclassified Luteimonas TaxID=2629088 RepID=UPI00320856FB